MSSSSIMDITLWSVF